MSNKWFSLTSVAAVLMICGIALSNQSSVADAKAGSTAEVSYPVSTPANFRVQPTSFDCRQVACADDTDCAITQGCSHNGCSHPAPGQAFGSCTVQPQ